MRRPARALPLAMAAAIAGCAQPAATPDRPAALPPAFGALGTSCAPDRLAALRAAGVTIVELPLARDRYEPAPGEVDGSYVTQARNRLAACRAAGLQVA